MDMKVKAVVINKERGAEMLSLSTKSLEEEAGEFISNPQKIYENAEARIKVRYMQYIYYLFNE